MPRVGELQERLGQKEPAKKESILPRALALVKEGRFDAVEAVAVYDRSTQRIDVLLRSRSEVSLNKAANDVPGFLDNEYQKVYKEYLTNTTETTLAYIKAEALESNRGTLAQIETQIENNRRLIQSTDPATVQNASSALENLETQRQTLRSLIKQKEDNVVYLEDALENGVGAAADEAVEVAVSSESEVSPTGTSSSSLVAVALLAVSAAVAMALRAAARRGGTSARSRGQTPAGA